MRLGDLEVGPALNGTLSRARENDERSQMVRCLEGLAELALRRGELDACSALGAEMLALADGGSDEGAGGARTPLARRGARSGRQARRGLREQLALAAAAAEKIGRVRLARDATAALAKVSGDPAHHARAAALAARIEHSARECEQLMAAE